MSDGPPVRRVAARAVRRGSDPFGLVIWSVSCTLLLVGQFFFALRRPAPAWSAIPTHSFTSVERCCGER
eukprot:13191033-Alexandrium_andersonii.AAC.1